MKRIGKIPVSPSAVISVLALVVAMGGTAFATSGGASSTSDTTSRVAVSSAQRVYFKGHAAVGKSVTLISKYGLSVMGMCQASPSGYPYTDETALGIRNKGQNNGFADTTDDDDSDFDIGDGVMFNYEDGGDGGAAQLPNGHSVNVPNGLVVPAGTGLGSDCYFSGVAFFG